jgi:phosphate transport system protein
MVRLTFHEELANAEQRLLAEGSLVKRQLERVLDSVIARDVDIASSVIANDDRVDEIYIDTETRILHLLALQAPVATDLRLVSAILHSNIHLERMGDLCVNIAKSVRGGLVYPTDSPMVTRIEEMGGAAAEMLEVVLNAFSGRSVELAEQLPLKDNRLDRLNRGMLGELKRYVDDERSFEWATNLILMARYLERFGDHCVDIAEQTSFLVTGVYREFTDASHPEADPV